eukprot:TRINITY_DN2121_c0_g2_i3.p1 TRINITY_DN2121_c0_g2~~TRINITY_DN2121_c0_g2_i3.p1  ORF type:complete len:236 (+),score=38.49 TRINITY_DN2121_c0_g2_i3:100-807(+)
MSDNPISPTITGGDNSNTSSNTATQNAPGDSPANNNNNRVNAAGSSNQNNPSSELNPFTCTRQDLLALKPVDVKNFIRKQGFSVIGSTKEAYIDSFIANRDRFLNAQNPSNNTNRPAPGAVPIDPITYQSLCNRIDILETPRKPNQKQKTRPQPSSSRTAKRPRNQTVPPADNTTTSIAASGRPPQGVGFSEAVRVEVVAISEGMAALYSEVAAENPATDYPFPTTHPLPILITM